jgi:hypothetical protein
MAPWKRTLAVRRTWPLTTFADEAADALNHAVASRVLRAEEDILFEVEAALERIALGTYGVCELSGKKIPLKAPRGDSLDALYRAAADKTRICAREATRSRQPDRERRRSTRPSAPAEVRGSAEQQQSE